MSDKTKMPGKKVLVYAGAITSLILAIVAIAVASGSDDPVEKMDGIAAGLVEVSASADKAKAIALEEGHYEVCIASAVSSSVAKSASLSVAGISGGECVIPAVSVDVADCVAMKPEQPSGADVPAVVELSLGPVIGVLKGFITPEEDDSVKVWATGVVDWISSGKSSIIDLIENPASGKLELDSVTIEGCVP